MWRAALAVFFFLSQNSLSLRAEIFSPKLHGGDLQWTARNLTYGLFQEPSDTARAAGLSSSYPENVVQNDLRVDVSWARGPFRIDLKPRADFFWQSWTSGSRSGEQETSANLYFYEWSGNVSLGQRAQAEYGLLNLQWGPSFLLSPSNPFDSRTGELNPKLELPPAAQYGIINWFPTSAWTVTLIANVDKGRKRYPRDFHPIYALKGDYVFSGGYASLIASYRTGSDASEESSAAARLGYYAGYNLTERLLVYLEGSSSKLDSENLIGLSYTTSVGPTLGLEYFHNSSGSDAPVQTLLLRPDKIDWREALFRRNYLLLQAYQRNLWGNLDYVFRWIASPDDDSHSANIQLDLGVSARTTLFTVATINNGDDDAELGAARDYQVMAGVEVAF